MDCSLPDSSVHGILQARISMEWIAIPFFRGSSWPRDQTLVSSIACRFFTIWATRGAPVNLQKNYLNVFLGQLHLFIYCLLSFYFLKDFLFLIWSTYRINKIKIAIEGIWSEREEVRKFNGTRSYFGRWNAPKCSMELVKKMGHQWSLYFLAAKEGRTQNSW